MSSRSSEVGREQCWSSPGQRNKYKDCTFDLVEENKEDSVADCGDEERVGEDKRTKGCQIMEPLEIRAWCFGFIPLEDFEQ